MTKPRVIVTRRWPEAVERELTGRFDAVLNPSDTPMSDEALAEAFKRADAVCPTVSDSLSANVFQAADPRVRVIAHFGAGISHIDLEMARERRIIVTNTPDVLTDCTADLAIMLMLMVARRAGEGERELRAGAWRGWRPTHMMGTRVSGKTLGLVGFGRIGRAVALRAHSGFGMRVIYHTPHPPPPEVSEALGACSVDSLEDLIVAADFISLHCPGGEATRHLFNEERIALVRRHAFLINTARGEVVDHGALIAALKAGSIAGAALDVYEGEPEVPAELKSMDKVVLLPHLGSASRETRIAMGMRVVENLEAFFAGREPPDRVN